MSDLVAANVQEARMRRGWSGRQLAVRCAELGASELTASVVANIESGRRDRTGRRRRDLSIDEVLTLALALGVHPADLLGPVAEWDEVRLTSEIGAAPGEIVAWLTDRTQSVVPSLLGGIAVCASCRRPMWARREGETSLYQPPPRIVYYCVNPHCPGPRVVRAALDPDEYVISEVLRLINEPGARAAEPALHIARQHELTENIEALETRRAEAQRTLENLADHAGVDPEVVARSLASFDRRIGQLRELRQWDETLRLLIEREGTQRDEWETFTLKEQRSMISAVIARIVLFPLDEPGSPSDSSTVVIDWQWESEKRPGDDAAIESSKAGD